jgi:hypothetical protein
MNVPVPAPTDPARWRVLIFPGGTEIGLEIREALQWSKEVTIHSAGSGGSTHAPYAFRDHTVVPPVGQPGWLEALQEVVRREGITHVFPAHDDALVALAEHAGAFRPAKIVTSPLATCQITRSKLQTRRLLEGVVPTPLLYPGIAEVPTYPVFLKPDRGQGSQRTDRAEDATMLSELLARDPDRAIWEFLPGEEYTIDCFSDRERGLLHASGRERVRIRAGIAMHSRRVDLPCFADYAQRIASVLPLHGAWFFQVKRNQRGELVVLEVAPRVGGTSALSRVHGVNLPLLSLYEAERQPVSILPGFHRVEIDRALRNRYRHDLSFQAVYCDYDDTLVVRDRLNVDAIRFLYQCVDRGIRVVLITRHRGNLEQELQRRRLRGLFDEVIHLQSGEAKAGFIRERPALFIDDSFAERSAVGRLAGVHVADPGMMEMLIDERA